MRTAILATALAAFTLLAGTAEAVAEAEADAMVLLDAAKLELGDGKLTKAEQLLARIPTTTAESYVAEEVNLQQLLLAAAFLTASHNLLVALEDQHFGSSAYAAWLEQERASRARAFCRHAREYLTRTAGGSALEFVRFRLPNVSEEHLQDAVLYMDQAVLRAARENWDEGSKGLGRGLIANQARVALVLAAAVHYDCPEPSTSIGRLAERLTAGVILDQVNTLDWLADTATLLSVPGDELPQIAALADRRIVQLTADKGDHPLRQRALARLAEAEAGQNKEGLAASD